MSKPSARTDREKSIRSEEFVWDSFSDPGALGLLMMDPVLDFSCGYADVD